MIARYEAAVEILCRGVHFKTPLVALHGFSPFSGAFPVMSQLIRTTQKLAPETFIKSDLPGFPGFSGQEIPMININGALEQFNGFRYVASVCPLSPYAISLTKDPFNPVSIVRPEDRWPRESRSTCEGGTK
jgi:hypothetical protein